MEDQGVSLSGDSSSCQLLPFPWPGAGAAAVKADDVMDQLYFIGSWRLRETLLTIDSNSTHSSSIKI